MSDQELKPCPNKLCEHNVDCSSECYSCGYSDCATELSRTPDPLLEELAGALQWISEDGHAMTSMTIGSRNRLLAAMQKYQQPKVQL